MKSPSVRERLVQSGIVDEAGLARALEIQARDGGTLGRILAGLGLATEEAVGRAVAEALSLEFVSLDPAALVPVPREIALPPEFCARRRVLPLGLKDGAVRLAMSDPLDHATVQDVEFRTSKWVSVVVATEGDIVKALQERHPPEAASFDLMAAVAPAGELEGPVDDQHEVTDPEKLSREVKLPPIVRLVNLALTDAAKAGASDIHIEPQEDGLLVRHRIDGVLHDVLRIPVHLKATVISRIKVIAGMDIAERRRPQDGRGRLRLDQRRIDLRVSSLPTNFGEKIVIRFLDSANAHVDLGRIGFAPDVLRRLTDLLGRPQGMIVVTGPTGSGKTSTLYAALNRIKSEARNIITVEDPIEYQLAGISQVQINTRAGVTFAAGLRSILRQDPDIVLVGEIRDRETAAIALEAAQTGHLLLSSLHTNDAPSSITRLLDLDIEPFMAAASLAGILAQRLVRLSCAECLVDRAPAPDALEKAAGARHAGGAAWRAGKGCAACRQTGYRGRAAIHELLVVDDAIRDLISRRAPEHEIRAVARRAGMRTLMEDGVGKAVAGLTTLDEVLRVAPPDEIETRTVPAAAARAPARQGPKAAAVGSPSRPPEAVRVLVVEDSPTVVTVVKYFLENEGYEVKVAEDGDSGLRIARDFAPHLVISDVNMPGLDGHALIAALRAEAATRDAGIILLTSETSLESEARGLAGGADDYLTKPVEPRRLVARVQAVLARAPQRHAGAA